MTYIKSFWKLIEHNRYGFVALLLCALLVGGCTWLQPKAPSPLDGKPVNRWQLQAQKAEFNAKFQAAEQMIAAQDSMWQSVIDLAIQAGAAVPGPIGGLLGAVPTIAAIGLGFDARRRSVVIADLKASKGGKK